MGVLTGPDRLAPAIEASVEYGAFDSAFAGQRLRYGLYIPESTPQAVLYCLHGRGGSHHTAFDGLGVHRFVAAMSLPWAVASVDGDESFWHRRAGGSDTQRMLFDEFMPLVATRAPTARPVGLGWSMGGFGVLAASLARPDAFDVIVASSPSLWSGFRATPEGAFDGPADFEANDVIRHAPMLEGHAVRIDCGDDDVFADAVREVHRRAPALNINIRAGFHEDATWRSFIPDQLEFVARTLGR